MVDDYNVVVVVAAAAVVVVADDADDVDDDDRRHLWCIVSRHGLQRTYEPSPALFPFSSYLSSLDFQRFFFFLFSFLRKYPSGAFRYDIRRLARFELTLPGSQDEHGCD